MGGILGGKDSGTPSSSGGGILGGKSTPKTVTPTRKPINGTVEQNDIMGNLDKSARLDNEYAAKKVASRNIPIVGSILKGLDVAGNFIETNPVTHFITQTGRDLASMGPVGSTEGLYGAAENVLGKYLPKLVTRPTAGAAIAGEAAKEALVGAPLGAGQTLAANPNASAKDLAEGAAFGAVGGSILGGGATALGRGAVRLADVQANKLAQNAIRQTAENTAPIRPVTSPLKSNFENPISSSYLHEGIKRKPALPLGRGEARQANAQGRSILEPGRESIATPYTFKLPEATQGTIDRTNNLDDAFKSINEIDNQINSLDSSYQKAINDQYQLLKEQRNNRGGITQGQLIKDGEGAVTGRVGRISNNPQWYQEFYKQNGKVPSNKDLYNLAKKHVDEGYSDNGVEIPSWLKENDYHVTRETLGGIRDNIRNSIKEKGLNITDAQLKDQRLKGLSKPSPKMIEPVPNKEVQTSQQLPEVQQPVQKQINKNQSEIDKLEQDLKTYKANRDDQVNRGLITREQANKDIKGHAMRVSADKRKLIQGDRLHSVPGGLTAKELDGVVKKLKSNYVGKEVIADGVEGKVKGNSFGRVIVEFPDGTTKSFETVTPKVNIDELIKSQQKEIQQPKTTVTQQSQQNLPTLQQAQNTVVQQAQTPTVQQPRPQIETVPNERGLVTNLRSSGKLTPEVQQGLEASSTRAYEPTKNARDLAKAEANVQKGLDYADSLISRPADGKSFSSEQVLTGFRLIQELQKQGEQGINRAVDVAGRLSEQLTHAGQAVQAASVWNNLTPEGALVRLRRVADKSGKTVAISDAKQTMDLAESAQQMGVAPERVNNLYDIADKVKKGEELKPEEMAELIKFTEDVKSFTNKNTKPKTEKPVKLPSEKKVREQFLATLSEKEKALQEFIKKNSNRVSSTPLDIWGAYTALGAIKLAKGAISFSKWSEQMIKDAGESIRPHLNNIYDSARAEAEQFEKLLPTPDKTLKVADAFVAGNKLSPKDAQSIYKLASDFGEMNRMGQQQTQMKMQEILNNYAKGSIEDKINAIRYIDMLGNTLTQLTNVISSPMMYIWKQLREMVQTPFDIARSKLTGTDRQITFKTGPSVWNNFFTPLADYGRGLKTGAEAGWKGLDPAGITSQDSVRGLAFKSKFNPFHWAEKSLGAVMKGADYGAYNMAAQNKLRKLAYLDALNKKVPENEISNYMDRYMNNIDGNISELMDKVGKEITFQGENAFTKGLRSTVKGLNIASTLGASQKLGLGSAILPFTKTPGNIMLAGLEHTPAGLLKGLYELATVRKNPNLTAAQISDTLTKSILGTAGLSGTGYVLSKLGIITGSSPSSSKDTQALEDEIGQGKFKFNTTAFDRMMKALVSGNVDDVKNVSKYQEGDSLLNYTRLQPLAFPVSIGATAAQQAGRDNSTSDKALETLSAGGQSLYDMSFLKGIQDAFNTTPSADQNSGFKQLATRIGQSYAKSFSPSLGGQEARREDQFQRQVTGKGLTAPVTEYFKSRTPSLGGLIPEQYTSKSLPKKVTSTGIEKRNEPGVIANYLNPLQAAEPQYNKASQIIYDLIQRTGDEKLAPTLVEKTIRGKDAKGKETTIALTPQQVADMQKKVGDRITKEVLKLPKLSDDKMAPKIEDIYTLSRSIGREQAKKELGLRYDKAVANKK